MRTPLSSHRMLHVHIGATMLLMLSGISEHHAFPFFLAMIVIPLMPFALLATCVLPLVILVLTYREQQSPLMIFGDVALSMILTVTSFFAILPLVQ